MDNQKTETSTRNAGISQKIGNFFFGILLGLALLALGFALLVWNEGHAVKAFKSLDEGLNIVISLKNIDEVNQENNGKLVHLIGPLSTDNDPLHPEIGDLRARLKYAGISGESLLGSPAMVTIVAKQLGSELVPYKTQAGDELEMLYFGQLLPKEIFDMEIFKKEKNQSTRLTWAIRFGGGLLVFIGNALLCREGDWTPISSKLIVIKEKLMNLASIVCGHVYMGVNFLNLTAMILSISMSFYAVGMGIGGYRPLQGFCVLLIGQTPLILLIIATRKSWKPKHD